jgi:proteic killer suppression protein
MTSITLDVIIALRYHSKMIVGFKNATTSKIFQRERVKRFSKELQYAALRKLLLLDAADTLEDLLITPGNRLERLSGNRRGQHSIRINDQWRICFVWTGSDAKDVEITDYH